MNYLNNYVAPKLKTLKSCWGLFALFFALFAYTAQAQTECQWTVTMQSNWGDGLAWELTGPDGEVIISKSTDNLDDVEGTFTAFSAGPVDFYVDTTLGWGDNTAIWTISNENGVLDSGNIGGFETYSAFGLSCDDEGYVPPSPCDEFTAFEGNEGSISLECHSDNLINGGNITMPLCGSASTSYLGGNESVITYNPTESGIATIAYSGQTWTGIFVFEGDCPVGGAGTCVASASSSSSSNSVTFAAVAGVEYYIIIDTYPSPQSPCPGEMSIELEAGCEGVPAAGDLSMEPTSGPAGTNTITMTASGFAEAAGIAYAWNFKFNDGEWQTLTTTTPEEQSLNVTGAPSDEVEIKLGVTCELSQETSFTDSVFYTFTGVDEYCIPIFTSSSDYLTAISSDGATEDFSYSTSSRPANGYDDQTDNITMMTEAGASFTMNTNYTGGSNSVRIWVDWNNDNWFGESEIMGELYDGNAGKTFNIQVPEGIADGMYRMRVRGNWSTNTPDPCAAYSFGSAVDINVLVGTLDGCTSADAGTPIDSFSICAGTAFILSTEGASSGESGLQGQWMVSTDGGESFTDIEGATSSSYTVSDGITEETVYKYTMSCVSDFTPTITDETFPITVSLADASVCMANVESSSSYYPMYSCYGYSYSQQIYLASDLGASSEGNMINGMSLYLHENSWASVLSNSDDWTIYLGNTSKSNFSGSNDWVGLDEMSEVFSGTVSFPSSGNWFNIEFDEAFIWDGTSNLVIAVDENKSSYNCTAQFGVQSTGDELRAIMYYSDSNNPNPASPPAANHTTSRVVNSIQLDRMDLDGDFCFSPNALEISNIGANGATFSWAGDADNYNYAITESDEEPTDFDTTSDTSVDLSDLDDGTTHYVWVRSNCGGDGVSDWAGTSFTTLVTPPSNDNPETASALGCGDSYSGNTQGATDSLGQGTTMCATYSSGYEHDVWFTFEADGMTDYTLTGSGFDGVIEVYDANMGAVKCIDNSGTTDTLTVETPDAGTYYVRYFAYFTSSTGAYTMSLECVSYESCDEVEAGGAIASEEEVCGGTSFTLSVSGGTYEDEGVTGLSGQWQVLENDQWADIDGATGTSYTVGSIDQDSTYRYVLSCENGNSNESNEVSVSFTDDPVACLCTPEGTNSSRYIDNFSAFGNGDSDIQNMGTGFSNGGYGDYSSMMVTADENGTISFEVDIVGGTAGFRIWVDWNGDGVFGANEVAYASDGYSNSHSGSFDVPEDFEGEARMRIVSHWLSTTGDVDPCATGFTYGEFEDYSVNVSAAEEPMFCDDLWLTVSVVFEGDCIDEGDTFDVTATLMGDVSEGITFTITDDLSNTYSTNAVVGEAVTYTYTAGAEATTLYATPNSSEVTCSADAGFESPGICAPAFDCPDMEADFGDECEDDDGNIGFVNGDCECEVEITPEPCDAPDSFTAAAIDHSSAILEWDGVDGAWGYEYALTDTNDEPDYADGSTQDTSVEVSGLEAETGYYAWVRTVCEEPTYAERPDVSEPMDSSMSGWILAGDGEGPSFVTMPEPCVDPSDVSGSAGDIEFGLPTAWISWTAGGSETMWDVVFSTDADFDPDTAIIQQSSDTEYQLMYLDFGTTYYAYVRAVCQTGGGNNSDWVASGAFVTEDAPVLDCPDPTGLSIDDVTQTSALMSWNHISDIDDGGWGYEFPSALYQVALTENADEPEFALAQIAATSYTFDGLEPSKPYWAWVRIVCNPEDSEADMRPADNDENMSGWVLAGSGPSFTTLDDEPTCGDVTMTAVVVTDCVTSLDDFYEVSVEISASSIDDTYTIKDTYGTTYEFEAFAGTTYTIYVTPPNMDVNIYAMGNQFSCTSETVLVEAPAVCDPVDPDPDPCDDVDEYYIDTITAHSGSNSASTGPTGYDGGYSDFTGDTFVVDLTESTTIDFTLTADGAHPDVTYMYELWVDRDQDGNFAEPNTEGDNEFIYADTSVGGDLSGTLDLQAIADILGYDNVQNEHPCDTYIVRVIMSIPGADCDYGEINDFKVKIISEQCDGDGPPTGGQDCDNSEPVDAFYISLAEGTSGSGGSVSLPSGYNDGGLVDYDDVSDRLVVHLTDEDSAWFNFTIMSDGNHPGYYYRYDVTIDRDGTGFDSGSIYTTSFDGDINGNIIDEHVDLVLLAQEWGYDYINQHPCGVFPIQVVQVIVGEDCENYGETEIYYVEFTSDNCADDGFPPIDDQPCSPSSFYINKVSGGDGTTYEENESGWDDGYGDYRDIHVVVDLTNFNVGDTEGPYFEFEIEADGGHPDLDYYYEAWVDRNQDGVYSNDELPEMVWAAVIQGGNTSGPVRLYLGDFPEYNGEGCLHPTRDYSMKIVQVVECSSEAGATPQVFTETEEYTLRITGECGGEMSVEDAVFSSFSYYPNPVETNINLSAASVIENVQVYNLLGQKVIEAAPNAMQTQINTESLASGVYMMKVTIEGAEKTFKVVRK